MHPRALARRLVDDYGIVKGDRVAILSSNRVEWLASFWAITSIGAIATGLNTWWNPDEIAYALSDSEPALLIVERNLLANAGPTKVRTLIIEDEFPTVDETELTDASFVLPDVEIGDDDDALILYSSGTTGRPKGVVTTHLAIITNLQNTMLNGLRIMMSRTDPAPEGLTHASLVTVPLFHVSGLHGSAVVGLAAGSKLVFLSGRFDPNEVLRLIETERVTAWGAVPTMIQRIVDHPELDKFDLSSMRNAGMGAAPVPLDLAERTAQAFPNSRQSVANGYGLTETTAVITVGSGDDWLSRPTSVGKPVPTNEVEVRDPATGKALPIGEEGEICIRGAIVMRGYWRKPEATAEAIDEDGFFRTGDLGRIDEDGFIHLTGRLKDLIIRGGENVYPVEIERRLALHPDVDDVAVVGVAHPDLGEEVMAVVQRRIRKHSHCRGARCLGRCNVGEVQDSKPLGHR